MIWKWGLGMCLTVLPFAGGCLQGASKSAETNVTHAANPAVTNDVTELDDAAALAAAATNAPAIDISQAEIWPVEDERPLAPQVRSIGPAGELLRMAAAGVEDDVILSYITNSASIFNLSADEIIYLKDVGASGAIVTAAMARDRELKSQGVPAYAEYADEPAPGSPHYQEGPTSNWTGGAQQPAPDQVAPQAVTPYPAEGQPPAPSGGVVTAQQPQVEVSYSAFYSSLSPYGRWMHVDGYGMVWQPTVVVVNRDWRPYFDGGRWIYTDVGWYWASDYSWGWAPFHYGRWFNHHRVGWCWVPDYVWGPSWVTWRYNDYYCGWAPLPPAAYYRPGFGFTYYGSRVGVGFSFGLGASYYSFVHWNHFHNRHHHRHAVPRHQTVNIYNNTKVVTKIVGNNNTVINEGISAQRVSAATRTQVRPVRLQETRDHSAVGGRAERLDPARRTLTVFKPETPQKAERAGGIPMERVRAGTRFADTTATPSGRPQGGASGEATRGRILDRNEPRVGGTAGNSESARMGRGGQQQAGSSVARTERRDGGPAAAPASPGTGSGRETPTAERGERSRTTVLGSGQGQNRGSGNQERTGQTPRRSEPLIMQGRSGGDQAQANTAPAARENPSTDRPGAARREIPLSPLTVPRAQTTPQTQTAPQTDAAAPDQQQRSTWSQAVPRGEANAARPTAPSRIFNQPATPQTQRVTPAQPSVSTPQPTPGAQTPSRVERQTISRPQTAITQPSAPVTAPHQQTAPSVTVPRQQTAPPPVAVPRQSTPSVTQPSQNQRQFSTPQTPQRIFSAPAPTTTPSAPVQRQFSAPAPVQHQQTPSVQRQFSAPNSAPQRQFSAPAPTVQPSAPAPSVQRQFSAPSSAPQRQFSAPSTPQRQFSAPAPSAPPSRIFSAPSNPGGGGGRGGGRDR
jgi:hypothetical protein